ncbi:hypothetical protein MASR1M101_04140 [Gemmatimonas sp.]
MADARMVLQQRFGYPDFRPPQRRAVEAVLSGRDALIVLPTGGGKSLCYQVPALVRGGLTVVVSPLISLMKDQVEALERRGIAAAYINSTLSASATADRMARARSGDLAMLYLSPERLESGRMSDQLHAVGLALLAVDEAHCISEWGHDFRPSYRRIGALRALLGAPQTVALTATATPDVRRDIERQLVLRDAEIVVGGFDRTNLTYHVRSHPTESAKDHAAVALLRAERAPSIVYTPTRKAVERVTGLLVRAGIKATAYHAGLAHTLRQRAQDAFMEERTRVIVATSAFGMGIDKPDVRLVVHHAMPGSLEAYYQEAGRAGRDGKASTCILLYDPADRATHDYFIAGTHPERHAVERTWAALRAAADGDGLVHASVEQVARAVPGVSERVAAAALRVLSTHHACNVEPPSPGRIWMRLLAAPTRIAAELVGERDFEREVLRAVWRATRGRVANGAAVDLDGLPPGFGGSMGLVPVLGRLAAQQFVMWTRRGGGVRLSPAARSASSPSIDWPQLAQRRETDVTRLDAMDEYARIHHCRRAYVLRYFGDPDARPHCGACDRCLEATGPLPHLRPAVRKRTWSRLRS